MSSAQTWRGAQCLCLMAQCLVLNGSVSSAQHQDGDSLSSA